MDGWEKESTITSWKGNNYEQWKFFRLDRDTTL